jgi:tetratricopeptide (TPR) repeat protein
MYSEKNQSEPKSILMKKLIVLAIAIILTFVGFANSTDDSVKVLMQKAKIEQEAGRHKLALEYLQQVVAINPNLIEAQRALGIAALEVRQFDLARQSFLTVLASQPNDAISLEKVTEVFYNFRKWDDAIKYGQKLLALKIGKRVNLMIGRSMYEKEDFAQCFKYLEAAFVEEPKNAEIPTMFARALVDMSNFKAAARYYLEALNIDTANNRLMNELGMTYSAMNDEKTAVKYYEMAMEKGYKVDNNFVENLSNSYIAVGMPQKGMQMLLKLLEKRPGDIDLLNNVANNYYTLGNYKEAINYWDKVLYLDRQEARALYMIGMCYIKMGDKNKGATLCNKAIEMDPSLKQFRNVSGGPFGR